MKTALLAGLLALPFVAVAQAADFHVALNGKDTNPGIATAPFRSIQHAADLAQPGDVITVRAGVYRERISPPRGGESDRSASSFRPRRGRRLRSPGRKSSRTGCRCRTMFGK